MKPKAYDRGSSLFWLFLSISVFVESFRLGIDTPRNPGTGFIAFGASGLLGILSLMLFFQTFFKKDEAEIKPLFFGTLWKRVLLVLAGLLIYARLMPVAGYLISTFLLMAFLYWMLERKKVWWVLTLSFLTTLITYYVFAKWLNCQFPDGLFGL